MKKERKELLIFLSVTYGLVCLMAIPMGIVFGKGKDVYPFAAAQMFFPAAGLMAAKLVCDRGNALLPRQFFLGFLGMTAVMILACFTPLFLPEAVAEGVSYVVSFSGLPLLALYFAEARERRVAYGLSGGRWDQTVLYVPLYLLLSLGSGALAGLLTEGRIPMEGLDQPYLLNVIVSLPLLLALNFSAFLGEEYGWRTFFQPLLQKKWGPIKGVLLFGLLWELWHFPLVLFYYAPQSPALSLAQVILSRLVYVMTIAIFLAFVYGKSHNVWLAVMVHLVNNLVGTAGGDTAGCGGETSWAALGVSLLVRLAFFLPFLCSKVFRAPLEKGPEKALDETVS